MLKCQDSLAITWNDHARTNPGAKPPTRQKQRPKQQAQNCNQDSAQKKDQNSKTTRNIATKAARKTRITMTAPTLVPATIRLLSCRFTSSSDFCHLRRRFFCLICRLDSKIGTNANSMNSMTPPADWRSFHGLSSFFLSPAFSQLNCLSEWFSIRADLLDSCPLPPSQSIFVSVQFRRCSKAPRAFSEQDFLECYSLVLAWCLQLHEEQSACPSPIPVGWCWCEFSCS